MKSTLHKKCYKWFNRLNLNEFMEKSAVSIIKKTFSDDCPAGIIFLLIIFLTSNVSADTEKKANKSQWELGIGVAALDIPLYPGSSQSKTYVVPVPHVLYRSENIEIDNGLQATFLKTPKVRIDLSADFGVPVNSEDSTARQGMPDIDLVLQVGPSVEVTLAGARFKPSHTRLELPVRAAIATDIKSAQHIGWIFEPRLTYETRRPEKTGFAYLLSAGLRYATEQYNDYYYAVDAEFVTPGRPVFDPSGGYSGLFVDVLANWRTSNLIYFAFVRYQNLSGTEFENSPLVEQNNYFFIGAGVTWVFARNI
jgi:outer membrane scaffolding protein for murein synthesis (MipA/OmpV family)